MFGRGACAEDGAGAPAGYGMPEEAAGRELERAASDTRRPAGAWELQAYWRMTGTIGNAFVSRQTIMRAPQAYGGGWGAWPADGFGTTLASQAYLSSNDGELSR